MFKCIVAEVHVPTQYLHSLSERNRIQQLTPGTVRLLPRLPKASNGASLPSQIFTLICSESTSTDRRRHSFRPPSPSLIRPFPLLRWPEAAVSRLLIALEAFSEILPYEVPSGFQLWR